MSAEIREGFVQLGQVLHESFYKKSWDNICLFT